jgi:ribonucleoside-diphosphate reductase alpha chain
MKKARPQTLPGSTYSVRTGCGTMYVTINEDENNVFEVFASMGKAGGCASSQIEAIGRLISLALRSGVDVKQIIKQLMSISCHWAITIDDNTKSLSCSDAIAKTIKLHLEQKEVANV